MALVARHRWRGGLAQARMAEQAPAAVPVAPTPVAAPIAPLPVRRGRQAAVPAAAPAPTAATFPVSPFRGVRVDIVLAGLLLYIFVTTSYKLNIASIAMAMALGGLVLRARPLHVPVPLRLFGLLILWGVAGYTQTRYPGVVMERLIELVKLWLIALVAVNALRERGQVRLYMVWFLGVFALFPVRGTLLNMYVYGNTTFGRAAWVYVFNNPNDLAAICILQLAMVAALVVREPKGWVRWAGLAGLGILPLIVLLTQSRGGIIALGAFTIVALLGLEHRGRRFVQLGIVAAILAFAAPDSVWERVRGLRNATDTSRLHEVDPEGSARQRFEIWKVAAKISGDHPVTGVGVGAYPRAHFEYALHPEFDRTARGYRDTHSTFLNVLAETGYLGLLLLVGILGSTFVMAERARRRARLAAPLVARQIQLMEVGLFCFLLTCVFGSYAYMPYLYLTIALLCALVAVAEQECREAMGASPAVPPAMPPRGRGLLRAR